LLVLDNPAEIIHPQDRGLTPMPMKVNRFARIRIDMLDDGGFQGLIGHPIRCDPWIQKFLAQIVAVLAR
ncbi:MAG: hypothetical protein V3S89_03055, partial [Desulfobacterales bacterium]